MSLYDLGVYPPLDAEHWAVTGKVACWLYGKKFCTGQRTALVPTQTPDETGSYTVQAKIVHASCFMRGKRIMTPEGARIVERIKDGDASPYPVITTDGKQWKDDEVERMY